MRDTWQGKTSADKYQWKERVTDERQTEDTWQGRNRLTVKRRVTERHDRNC